MNLEREYTRVARLRADVDRSYARNEGTCVPRRAVLHPPKVDHREVFNRHQRRMMQIAVEYGRPGVAVFGLHARAGFAGHCWLSASDELRAGTIGRHSAADLMLEDDEALSLRHLMVLTRRTAAGPHIRVVDLVTPTGFQAEKGEVLRAVEANGPLILRAASYSLVVVPTGGSPLWDSRHADPFSTLPRRVIEADERAADVVKSRRSFRRVAGETLVTFHQGPVEPGPEPMLQPREKIVGSLMISNGTSEEIIAVGPRALARGVVLGRYSRCTGDTTEMSMDVSRVHAVVMHYDGSVYLADAGSTNGTFKGEELVKCVKVEAGLQYRLAGMKVRWVPGE